MPNLFLNEIMSDDSIAQPAIEGKGGKEGEIGIGIADLAEGIHHSCQYGDHVRVMSELL